MLALILAGTLTTSTFLDQSYGPSPWQEFDAYVPTDPVAVALVVRGGGTASGDENIDPLAYQALLDRRIAIVSCDYAGYDTEGGVFPVPQRDVAGCLRFLDANRAAYGLGKAKLGTMGKSYGAMLATSVVFAPPSWYQTPQVDFVIDLQGMTDWRLLAPGADPAWAHVNNSTFPSALERASGMWHLEQAWGDPPPKTYIWYDLPAPGMPPLSNPHDPYFGLELQLMLDRMGVENQITLGSPTLDMAEVGDFILSAI